MFEHNIVFNCELSRNCLTADARLKDMSWPVLSMGLILDYIVVRCFFRLLEPEKSYNGSSELIYR
jgi:hypothetical protein